MQHIHQGLDRVLGVALEPPTLRLILRTAFCAQVCQISWLLSRAYTAENAALVTWAPVRHAQ